MTAEHLFPLLESTHTLETLCEVAGFFARAEVPQNVAGIAFGTHDSPEETIWRHSWDCRE